jgi:polysaccharide export outer membrane protein
MQQSLGVAVAQESGVGTLAGAGTRSTANNNLGAVDGALSLGLTGGRRPLYCLQETDVVEIAFSFTPEFNQTVTIQPDGYANLKSVGQLFASGHTLPEFTEVVRQAYGGFLRDPELTVILKEFQKPYFIAAGEVSHPGKYELRPNTTLAESIAISGGFTSRARESHVLVFRRVDGQWSKPRVSNVKQLLAKGQLEEDLLLRPGDLIFVPQSTLAKIRKTVPPVNLGLYANPAQF